MLWLVFCARNGWERGRRIVGELLLRVGVEKEVGRLDIADDSLAMDHSEVLSIRLYAREVGVAVVFSTIGSPEGLDLPWLSNIDDFCFFWCSHQFDGAPTELIRVENGKLVETPRWFVELLWQVYEALLKRPCVWTVTQLCLTLALLLDRTLLRAASAITSSLVTSDYTSRC